jgi:predicted nucleic acid-binding protein
LRYFLDTNVLVYAEDASQPHKRDLAIELVAAHSDDDLVVSTQVLVEFYRTALRRRLCSPAQARTICGLWTEREVIATTPTLVLRAMELQQRRQLSIFDALIVQSALDAGCDVLYTEDLQAGARFGELQVIDPFRGSHAVHEPPTAYRRKTKSAARS